MLPPLQLQYDPPIDTSYSDVVTNRLRTVINHPKQTFSPGERIAFVLNTTSFVDLRSVKLQARVKHIETGVQSTFYPHYTPYLFENIILKTTGGTIIEHIEQSQTVGHLRDLLSRRVVDNETQSTSYMNTTGAYFDERNTQEYTPIDTNVPNLITLSAYDLLGFFNMNKIMRMSTMGGLIIEFLLAAPEAIVQFRGDRELSENHLVPSTFNYQLSRVQTIYDEVEVTDAFLSNYTAKYERKGFTLEFMSVINSRDFVLGLTGRKVIPLHRSLERCKYIISIARPSAAIVEEGHPIQINSAAGSTQITSYNNFLAPAQNDFSFQYKLAGELLPRREVNNYLTAYHELEKIIQTDVTRRQRNNLSLENFSSNLLLKRPNDWKRFSHFRFNTLTNNTAPIDSGTLRTTLFHSVDFIIPDYWNWHRFVEDEDNHSQTHNRSFYVKTTAGGIFKAMFIKNPAAPAVPATNQHMAANYPTTNTPYNHFLRVYINGYLPENLFIIHEQSLVTTNTNTNRVTGIPINTLHSNNPTTSATAVRSNATPKTINVKDPAAATIGTFTFTPHMTFDAKFKMVYPDVERYAHQGSFMMGISLNSVDTITSSNTKPIDAANAFLEFDFNSTYNTNGFTGDTGYKFETTCVDTFMYHYTTLRVSDGQVEVSR